MNVAIDYDAEQYLLTFAGNSVLYSFDEVESFIAAMEQVLPQVNKALPKATSLDPQMAKWEIYQECLVLLNTLGDLPPLFEPGVCPDVLRALEQARTENRTVRLFYGNPESGEDWLCPEPKLGRLDLSNGPVQSHLLELVSGETAVVTSKNVIRIVDSVSAEVLYTHQSYSVPAMKVDEIVDFRMGERYYAVKASHIRNAEPDWREVIAF